jgi:hypothetical protein
VRFRPPSASRTYAAALILQGEKTCRKPDFRTDSKFGSHWLRATVVVSGGKWCRPGCMLAAGPFDPRDGTHALSRDQSYLPS